MGLDTAIDTLLHNGTQTGRGLVDATSKIYGVVPAIVIAVHDKDKSRHTEGWVQIYFPWLQKKDGETKLIKPWARLARPAAGAKAGLYVVPQIGDEVVVGFEHGDPQHPYILGSVWNKKYSIPGPKTDADGTSCTGHHSGPPTHKTPDLTGQSLKGDGPNQTYYWRSRTGNLIVLDDKTGVIRIADRSGTSVLQIEKGDVKLLQKKGDLTIYAKERVRFDCENFHIKASNSITFNSKGGNWGMKCGGKMTMTAGMNFSAQAKAQNGGSSGEAGIFLFANEAKGTPADLTIDSSMALTWVSTKEKIYIEASEKNVKLNAIMKLSIVGEKDMNLHADKTFMATGLMGLNWTAKGHMNIKAGSMIMCKAMCINLN